MKSHYFPRRSSRSVAGFYTFVETFGEKPVIGICEPAFTGSAFAHATNLISRGEDDAEASAMGAAVLDSWLETGMRNGLLCDFWCDNLFGLPVRRPFTFEPPLVYPHNPSAATRRLAEAISHLLAAAQVDPQRENWRRAALLLADQLVNLQLPEGGFARRYRFRDHHPLQADNLGATPNVVTTLLDAFDATGLEHYRAAAVRAGEFLLREMVAPLRFHGSTLDADCEDKEAATATLHALRRLHETTGEDQWLDAASKVAWLVVSWISLVDIPFADETLLGKWKLRTRGLTLVSTENNHLDVYLFTTPADLYWLGEARDDDALKSLAWTTLLAAMQIVPTAGYPLGPTTVGGITVALPAGLVPELIHQTTWVYMNKPLVKRHRRWIKGSIDHKTSMWTSASIWAALDAMRAVVPREEWRSRFRD